MSEKKLTQLFNSKGGKRIVLSISAFLIAILIVPNRSFAVTRVVGVLNNASTVEKCSKV